MDPQTKSSMASHNKLAQHSKEANTTTHGLRSTGLLRCRYDRCFYWDVCPLQAHIDRCFYGYRCLIEIERFKTAYSGYKKSLSRYVGSISAESLDDLIYQLAMTEIQAMRADNALAVTATMPGGKREGNSGPSPTLLWRYRSELYIKRNRIFAQIQELRSTAIP